MENFHVSNTCPAYRDQLSLPYLCDSCLLDEKELPINSSFSEFMDFKGSEKSAGKYIHVYLCTPGWPRLLQLKQLTHLITASTGKFTLACNWVSL